MKFFGLLIILLISGFGKGNLIFPQNNFRYILAEFFKTEYFPSTYSVVVLPIENKKHDNYFDLHSIFIKTNRKLLLVNQFDPHVINGEEIFFILNQDNNIVDLLQHLQDLRKALVFNPKVMIWFKTPVQKSILIRLFEECAKSLIIRVIIAHPEEQKNTGLKSKIKTNSSLQIKLTITDILQYFHKPTDLIPIQSLYVDIYNIPYILCEISDLFKKYSLDLKGIELTVMAIPQYISVLIHNRTGKMEFTGVDISALNLMAALLNFTPNIIVGAKEHYGDTFKNGSLTKSIHNLLDGKVFMNINRYIMPLRLDISLVFAIDRDSFCFILNDAPDLRLHWTLISAFQPRVWFAICGTVVTMCIFWKISQIHKEIPSYPTIILFQALFSTRYLKPYFVYQHILWIFWLIFAYLMYSSIIGMIVKQIMKPIRKQKVKTLKELLDSNITIKSYIGQFDLTQNNSVIKSLMDKAIDVFNVSVSPAMLEKHYSAILTSTNTRIHFDNIYKTSTQHFYVLPECVYSTYSGYTISTHHPLLDTTRVIVRNFVEHGFYTKWVSDYTFNQTLVLHPWKLISNKTITQNLTCFSIKDLHLAFIVYFFGLLIALIIFVFEIVLYKVNKYKTQRKW